MLYMLDKNLILQQHAFRATSQGFKGRSSTRNSHGNALAQYVTFPFLFLHISVGIYWFEWKWFYDSLVFKKFRIMAKNVASP